MSLFLGRLLRVDLSRPAWRVEEIPEEYHRLYISGRGLGARYIYGEIAAGIDPLGPENKLYLVAGVLAASGLQGFSKWCVMSKSPLTGTIFRSITGGNFGAWMKYAGYDLIIVEGRAPGPTYIHLDGEGLHFLDADDLWGLEPRKLQRLLKDRHGHRTESACIGAAGERLVRYAVIASGERTAARGGMGAVMGAKNLKAFSINVRARKLAPFDPKRFKRLVAVQLQLLQDHPRRRNMTSLGTPYITSILDEMGILPVRNFTEGKIKGVDDISGWVFHGLKKKKAGCYHCMTRCGGIREVTEGPLKGSEIDGPEYETIYAFGPLLGMTDKGFVIAANALCDHYGIDTISAGVCMAFACEMFERDIIGPSESDGLDIRWGNKEALLCLLEKIGRREEGLGRLLAEGVKRAADRIGGRAASFAMHVKGLEMPGYEPRGVKGYGLSMATSNIGGSHMYGRPRDELRGEIDRFDEKGKGWGIARVQVEQALEDSLIACTFGNSGLDISSYAQMLEAATGMEEFSGTDWLLATGERIICLERGFNVEEGFGRKDDTLPERILSEPLKNAGPSTGQRFYNLDGLLDEYYDALGYDREGIPTKEKIRDLGIASALDRAGFLKEGGTRDADAVK